ncbi:Appr-1-p processing protein [Halobacteriales archaeon QH_6_64_20]|nr:MAG: Appr-1-p processing protein [Halobacteriales archaeon QH_6_64_20]
MDFDVVQGDIAAERTDALVNAAGTSLEMGSGVAGALRRRGGEELNEAASEATRRSLAAADERGCESIVIPALGCGVAGFDLSEGTRIIAEEIAGFEADSLADARLIGYSDDEYERMRAVAEDVRANGES